MRLLVFFAAVSWCSAQLQVVPTSTFIPSQGDKPILATPYIYPFNSPIITPYSSYPFITPYTLGLRPGIGGLIPTQFPYVYTKSEEAVKPAVNEARRRRRRAAPAVEVPLPYVQATPTLLKSTINTQQFEPVDAATPADTTKLSLTTRQHEVALPAIQYTQPTLAYRPIPYNVPAISPLAYRPIPYNVPAISPLPYTIPSFPYYPYIQQGLPYAPVLKVDKDE